MLVVDTSWHKLVRRGQLTGRRQLCETAFAVCISAYLFPFVLLSSCPHADMDGRDTVCCAAGISGYGG